MQNNGPNAPWIVIARRTTTTEFLLPILSCSTCHYHLAQQANFTHLIEYSAITLTNMHTGWQMKIGFHIFGLVRSTKAEDMDGSGAPWFKWERELMVKVD